MSDFDEWRSNFLISINSDGNFRPAFDKCIIYVEQIALFNQICTYSNKTDSFLAETLKPAIDTILRYPINSGNRNKLGDITYFLKYVTVLLQWVFVNDKFNLFDIFNQLTNPEMELYESIKKEYGGRCENLVQIKKYIIEHEYMTIMLMRIRKTVNLQVDHFLFFFQTFNKISELMNENTKLSMLFGLYEPFQNFLNQLIQSGLKNINPGKLQELYTNFCILASTMGLDMFTRSIEHMTLLAYNLFISESFDNQKLGSTLFKIFAETKNKQEQEFINHIFINSLSKYQLISKILSQKLNSENHSIVSPLIDQICKSEHIKGNDLISIWESAIKTTKPESESTINTLISILKQIKFSEVDNFFKMIPVFPKKVPNISNDQKDQYSLILENLTNLIVELMTKREKIISETAQIIFNKLFDSAEQYIQLTNNQPDDFLNLKKIYMISKDNKKNNNNSNLNQMRKELVKVLHIRFTKEYKSYNLRLLTDIASTSNYIREDFDEKDIKVIGKYIIDLSHDENVSNEDDVQYSLYPLYTILINEFNQQISFNVLNAMLESPSDALWDFLYQIIEKSKLKNFEEDAIPNLSTFILKNYMQKSTLFLDFLKLFILNTNERANAIVVPHYSSNFDDYTIKKTPLLFEETVLEKIIIETDDDSILKHVIEICFDIYDKYPSQDEVILKLLSLFNKFVNDEQNIRTKTNIITFLFQYCKKYDKAKTMSIISHNKVFTKSLTTKLNGKYSINFELPDKENVQLKFDVQPSMHTLYVKIAPFLHSSIYNFCICKKNGTPYSLNEKVDFSVFKKQRNVKVKEVKDGKFVEKDKKDDNNDKKDDNNDKKDDNNDKKDDNNDKKDDDNDKKDDNNESISSSNDDDDKKKIDVIRGGGFIKDYEQIPSEILVQNNVTKTLFNILNHFNNPSLGNDENQSKLDELVYEFLSYLPTDPDLFVLSDSHEKFIPESLMNFDFQSFINTKYSLQYILQVLILRLNCHKYIELYKNSIQQLLSRIISVDDSSLSLVTFLKNETLRFIELLKLNSNDFILLLIKMLSLASISNNSDEFKRKIIKILDGLINGSNEIDISDLLCDQIDIFISVLTSISNKVWSTFKESILFKMKNPEKLFRMILDSLLQCDEEDMMNQINRYYTDIFSHFIIPLSNKIEDADEINNIVKIFMKMLRINPTQAIIDSFEKIVTKNKELLQSQTNECSLENIIDGLINIVRLDSKPSMMNKIVDLLMAFSSIDEKSSKQLNDFAEQISSYKIKGWNQMSIADQQSSNSKSSDDDDDDTKSGILSISKKEKGLRNINQTCYMNSALQQFYHIPAFRYFISDPKQSNGDDELPITPSLSSLFTNMEFSKKKEINPEEFFMIFSSKHSDFEPGKQQDCQEFVDYFIDDIKGKAHDLFEWKILTKYQKLDLSEISSKEETSVSIPLAIESGSMREAVKEYFSPQRLTGDNLYQASDGTKMESIVTQKIITAPPVLIFQLKRFDYDKGTQNRVKINKRFEIMNNICMKQYMLNNDKDKDPYNYILNGVVVHSGNGMHGHYTSLIKEDIHSDNWLRYDDSDVSYVETREEFEKVAFGENKDDDSYGTNGYLLFYIRENATVNVAVNNKGKIVEEQRFILDNSFPSHISEQLESNIEADNNNFLFNQCALEKSTFMFMMNCGSNVQLLKYFFGIFVHTKMINKIKEIEDKLLSVASISDSSVYLQFMDDDSNFKEYILPVFSNLSPEKMETASFKIISKIISTSKDKEIAANLVQRFIQNLKEIHKKWNRVCHIGNLILDFIQKQDNECLYAIKNKWEKSLLNYIFDIYEEKNANIKNINIETIFQSLGKIITNSSSRDSSCLNLYLKLPTINDKVRSCDDDSCKESYKELIIDCISSQIFSVNDVDEALGNDFPRLTFILHHQLEKAKPDTFPQLFESLISVQGFTVEEIIDDISDSKKLATNLLGSNLQIVINLLVFNQPFTPQNDLDASKIIANLITKPVYGGKPKLKLDDENEQNLFNMLKLEIPKMEKAYQPFFTVLNYLIQKLDIPSSEKIDGLEELVSKSREIEDNNVNSNDKNIDITDMINIEIHFQPDKLTKRCEELLKQAGSPNPSDMTFDNIISLIEACETKPLIFGQIVSLPDWKSVIKKQYSSRSLSFMKKLLTSLSKVQRKILGSIKNDEENSEITRFSLLNAASYLNSLIVESPEFGDYRFYSYIPDLEGFITESFKKARDIINQNKGSKIENESDVHFLYIEPDFQVILDFNSYLKIIENMIKDSKRNEEKDTAMNVYSNFIVNLICLSKDFADSIKNDDSDKLNSIKQFIEISLSSMKLNPSGIMNSNTDAQKDSFVVNLINLSDIIAKCNNEFSKEMNKYIKKNINNGLSILQLFRLKFGLHEIIDMPVDKRTKEILQLDKKNKKHREVFFSLLSDVMFECNDHEFLKNVVSSLLIEETQMSERSFMTAQISRDTSNSIYEKNFFEQMLTQFTDSEFDEVLNQIHLKYKPFLEAPADQYTYELMQVTTKFLVMMCAKPEKKNDITKLIPNKGKDIGSRPSSVVKLIFNFKG